MLHRIKAYTVLVLLLFILSPAIAYSDKVAVLDDVLKPTSIFVDKDQLLIVEGFSVLIYSLNDFQLIKKFGKKGEGPREFLEFIAVASDRDHIYVNSRGKISYYTKDGQFIKEMRPTSHSWSFVPMGANFVGFSFSRAIDTKAYCSIYLFDEELKKVKELSRYAFPLQRVGKINPLKVFRRPLFYVNRDKIYFQSGKDEGTIECFDKKGELYINIVPGVMPVKFTAKDEKKLCDFFIHDPRLSAAWEAEKARVEFPEFYPVIKYFQVVDDKIYVVSNKQLEKSRHFECFVLDLEGNLLKRSAVHIRTSSILEYDEFPYYIWGGRFYQVVENFHNEDIELHINDI